MPKVIDQTLFAELLQLSGLLIDDLGCCIPVVHHSIVFRFRKERVKFSTGHFIIHQPDTELTLIESSRATYGPALTRMFPGSGCQQLKKVPVTYAGASVTAGCREFSNCLNVIFYSLTTPISPGNGV